MLIIFDGRQTNVNNKESLGRSSFVTVRLKAMIKSKTQKYRDFTVDRLTYSRCISRISAGTFKEFQRLYFYLKREYYSRTPHI